MTLVLFEIRARLKLSFETLNEADRLEVSFLLIQTTQPIAHAFSFKSLISQKDPFCLHPGMRRRKPEPDSVLRELLSNEEFHKNLSIILGQFGFKQRTELN